jgi:DNA recombination protein RmuC
MEMLILVALVVLIVLVVLLLFRTRSGVEETIASSLEDIQKAKEVISDHALKTITEIKGIGETVSKLVQQQEQAEKLGESLKDLLQAPKLRGDYGEAILEELLDRVLPSGIWERQYVLEGREIVDCVVRFKGIVIPIDSKFPRDDYMRYMEAQLGDEKAMRWKDFERVIKEKIMSIESKYVKPEQGTSEFAMMFIPSEAIYYETIAEKNQLGNPSAILEYAQAHHVLPVGPNTFYAFLQIIVIGIRNVEIIKSAKRLQDGLSGIQRSFELFYGKYLEIGKGIERATEAYRVSSGHIDRYKRHLDDTIRLQGAEDDVNAISEEVPED